MSKSRRCFHKARSVSSWVPQIGIGAVGGLQDCDSPTWAVSSGFSKVSKLARLHLGDAGLARRAEQARGPLQLVPVVGCGRVWVRAAGSRWCDPLRRGGFLGFRADRAGLRTSNPAADCEEECQQSYGGDQLPVPVAALDSLKLLGGVPGRVLDTGRQDAAAG